MDRAAKLLAEAFRAEREAEEARSSSDLATLEHIEESGATRAQVPHIRKLVAKLAREHYRRWLKETGRVMP